MPGFEPYGYQLVGTALRSGEFSAEFLNAVGGDMVAFEQANPEAFSSNMPNSGMYAGFRLNHIDDSGAGFDPLDGLMIAMERNPEASREFFDPRVHPDRIGYLLDRGDWHDRLVFERPDANYEDRSQSYVLDALAAASDGQAPGNGPGFDIAVSTIDHAGSTEPDTTGLVNDSARASMGRLIEGQLPQVNDAYAGGGSHYEDRGSRVNLERVLGDVGRSPEAYASLREAEAAFAAHEMNRYASKGDLAMDARLAGMETAGYQMGSVLAHLDYGRAEAIDEGWVESAAEYDRRVEATSQVGAYALSKAVSAIPGGDLLSSVVLDEIVESAKVDYGQHAAGEIADLHGDTRVAVRDMAEQIVWDNQLFEAHDAPPEELFHVSGEPIALSDMTTEERDAFRDWSNEQSSGYGAARAVVRDIQDSYATGSKEAAQSQQGGH
jgi:hypothetical protein